MLQPQTDCSCRNLGGLLGKMVLWVCACPELATAHPPGRQLLVNTPDRQDIHAAAPRRCSCGVLTGFRECKRGGEGPSMPRSNGSSATSRKNGRARPHRRDDSVPLRFAASVPSNRPANGGSLLRAPPPPQKSLLPLAYRGDARPRTVGAAKLPQPAIPSSNAALLPADTPTIPLSAPFSPWASCSRPPARSALTLPHSRRGEYRRERLCLFATAFGSQKHESNGM